MRYYTNVQTITTIRKLYMRLKKPNDVIDCFEYFENSFKSKCLFL